MKPMINQNRNTQQEPAKKKPEMEFFHKGLRVTVWNNSRPNNNGGIINNKSIKIEKRYMQDNKWNSTQNFQIDDLLKLSHVANQIYTILTNSQETTSAVT